MSQNEKENSIIELALSLGKHVEQSHQNFVNIANAINGIGTKLKELEEKLTDFQERVDDDCGDLWRTLNQLEGKLEGKLEGEECKHLWGFRKTYAGGEYFCVNCEISKTYYDGMIEQETEPNDSIEPCDEASKAMSELRGNAE